MKAARRAEPLQLTWEEVGFISEGLAFSSRALRNATASITEEHLLGPRGAWIVLLISTGEVYPLDLTKVFHCGRSLVTAELTRLTQAGLVSYRKSNSDGRRVELTLTPLGKAVERRVKEETTRLILQRLGRYTREEVLLCARMLRDFRAPLPPAVEAGASDSPPPRRRTTRRTSPR